MRRSYHEDVGEQEFAPRAVEPRPQQRRPWFSWMSLCSPYWLLNKRRSTCRFTTWIDPLLAVVCLQASLGLLTERICTSLFWLNVAPRQRRPKFSLFNHTTLEMAIEYCTRSLPEVGVLISPIVAICLNLLSMAVISRVGAQPKGGASEASSG